MQMAPPPIREDKSKAHKGTSHPSFGVAREGLQREWQRSIAQRVGRRASAQTGQAEAHGGFLHAEHGPREREALAGAKGAASAPPQPHVPPEGWGASPPQVRKAARERGWELSGRRPQVAAMDFGVLFPPLLFGLKQPASP